MPSRSKRLLRQLARGATTPKQAARTDFDHNRAVRIAAFSTLIASFAQLTPLSPRTPPSHPHQTLDPQSLRHAFASFATGVTVITALDSLSSAVGMTANSFGSVSLDPPLVQWSLRVNSGLHRTFVDATLFSVSVLSAGQEHLARQFSSRAPDRFAGVSITHFVCKKVNDYRVGDHELFICEVLRAKTYDGVPLVFHDSKFKQLAT
jgi:flavin reductase (DIM6/NTAB) family NADH-FMN oxidoreductase RutF